MPAIRSHAAAARLGRRLHVQVEVSQALPVSVTLKLMRKSVTWLFVCLLFVPGRAAAQAPTAGKALSARGPVEWEHPAWAALAANQMLEVGAHIRTGDAGRAVILLVDET